MSIRELYLPITQMNLNSFYLFHVGDIRNDWKLLFWSWKFRKEFLFYTRDIIKLFLLCNNKNKILPEEMWFKIFSFLRIKEIENIKKN